MFIHLNRNPVSPRGHPISYSASKGKGWQIIWHTVRSKTLLTFVSIWDEGRNWVGLCSSVAVTWARCLPWCLHSESRLLSLNGSLHRVDSCTLIPEYIEFISIRQVYLHGEIQCNDQVFFLVPRSTKKRLSVSRETSVWLLEKSCSASGTELEKNYRRARSSTIYRHVRGKIPACDKVEFNISLENMMW